MIILIYLLLCVLVAVAARRRRRSRVAWFMWAFWFSPLFAALILLLIGPKTPKLPDPGEAPNPRTARRTSIVRHRTTEAPAGIAAPHPDRPEAAPEISQIEPRHLRPF